VKIARIALGWAFNAMQAPFRTRFWDQMGFVKRMSKTPFRRNFAAKAL
jgi:hypothetical protein